MSLTCLTDQMVNTRSGSGVDQPLVQCRRRGSNSNPHPNNMNNQNNHNQVPPPLPQGGMEQFLITQTQLLTNKAATMANMQVLSLDFNQILGFK